MEETIRVCADCFSEVHEHHAGDEGWSICSGCGNVEQETEEWTLEKFEKEGNQ